MRKEIIIPIAPAGLPNLAAYGLDLAIQAEQNGIFYFFFHDPNLTPRREYWANGGRCQPDCRCDNSA